MIRIGDIVLPHGLMLAPMAGYTDRATRVLCHELGAEYTVTEMVSAKAVCFGDRKTPTLARICADEGPCAVQIFGSDPAYMAEAARRLSDGVAGGVRPAAMDINMGCPVAKVAGNGEGSALMRDPQLVERIVSAVRLATPLPVTVKIRAGYDDDHKNAVEIAQLAQKAGISAVTVHGRTKEQGYSGTADRSIIADVAKNVDIPVIGNGDIVDGASAADMLSRGCAGIMIGRAAQGNPWIFAEILAYLNDTPYRKPSWEEKKPIIMRHAQNLVALKRNIAMRQMRRHMCDYVRGMRGAAAFRANINSLNTLDDLRLLLDNLTD